MCSCIKNAQYSVERVNGNNSDDGMHIGNRWDRILMDKSNERVWKAIDWKGTIE